MVVLLNPIAHWGYNPAKQSILSKNIIRSGVNRPRPSDKRKLSYGRTRNSCNVEYPIRVSRKH